MAKKEARRAIRGTQQKAKAGATRGPRRPTLRRAVTQAAMLAGLYFILVQFLFKSKTGVNVVANLTISVLFFFVYVGFIYFWERWLWRRRQANAAKRQEPKGKK